MPYLIRKIPPTDQTPKNEGQTEYVIKNRTYKCYISDGSDTTDVAMARRFESVEEARRFQESYLNKSAVFDIVPFLGEGTRVGNFYVTTNETGELFVRSAEGGPEVHLTTCPYPYKGFDVTVTENDGYFEPGTVHGLPKIGVRPWPTTEGF